MTALKRLAVIGALAVASWVTVVPGAMAAAPAPAASAAAASDTSGSAASAGPAAGSNLACTSYYNWYVSGGTTYGGYAKVEWTSNPCGQLIQVRVWCYNPLRSGSGYWSYSGIVKRTYLWDQAGCPFNFLRGGSYVHFSYDGGNTWSSFKSI